MQDRQKNYKNMEEFIKAESGGSFRGCVELANEVLNRTGHIPTVTNIARGAGYCAFYARLSETIGIRKFFDYSVDHYSGKGKPTHKILAYAALKLFPGNPSEEEIKDAIEKSIDENMEILERDRAFINDKENVKNTTLFLMKSLVSSLDKICELLGVSKNELSPIVEQQFMDYGLHIRGIPDLILESKEKKKAAVIEWKTYGSPEMRYEEAQVVAYSLLEASRLDRPDPRKAVQGTLEKDSHSIDVLPVVIKATLKSKLGPHPFLSGDFSEESYRDFSYLMDDVTLEAEHLTSLLANTSYFVNGKTEICNVTKTWGNKEYKVNLLRLTPNQFWKGSPSKQEKWPCRTRDGRPFCNLMDPCKFYFGKNLYEQDSVDRDMWLLRFKVFENKENSLLIYRALYDIFNLFRNHQYEADAFTHLSHGGGFIYSPGDFPNKKDNIPQIIISRSGRFRVETLDNLKIADNPNSLQLQGKRKLRDFEKDNKISFVIPDGKTVLLTMMDSWNPLLSISVFAKISEVKSSSGEIEYAIDVPSTVLDFQMSIFMEYLKKQGSPEKFLMFEVNADLTQMELNSIHALQMALHENLKNNSPISSGDSTLREEKTIYDLTENQEKEIENEGIDDPEVYGLVETLTKLVKRSSEKS